MVDDKDEAGKTDGPPDVVIVAMLPDPAGAAVRAYREAGYPIPLLANNSFRRGYQLKAAGALANGLEGSSITQADKGPSGQAFLKAFMAAVGETPEMTSSGAYNSAVTLMLAALTAAGDGKKEVTAEGIRAGLGRINDPKGKVIRPTVADFAAAARAAATGEPVNYEGAFHAIDWDARGDMFQHLRIFDGHTFTGNPLGMRGRYSRASTSSSRRATLLRIQPKIRLLYELLGRGRRDGRGERGSRSRPDGRDRSRRARSGPAARPPGRDDGRARPWSHRAGLLGDTIVLNAPARDQQGRVDAGGRDHRRGDPARPSSARTLQQASRVLGLRSRTLHPPSGAKQAARRSLPRVRSALITGCSSGICRRRRCGSTRRAGASSPGSARKRMRTRWPGRGSRAPCPADRRRGRPGAIEPAAERVVGMRPRSSTASSTTPASSTRGPLEYVPLDDFRKQLEVNLVGQLAVTQAMVPRCGSPRAYRQHHLDRRHRRDAVLRALQRLEVRARGDEPIACASSCGRGASRRSRSSPAASPPRSGKAGREKRAR